MFSYVQCDFVYSDVHSIYQENLLMCYVVKFEILKDLDKTRKTFKDELFLRAGTEWDG